MTMATTTKPEVVEIDRPVRHGRDGQEFWQVFRVRRDGRAEHRVEIRCSIDGTPQYERCDCPAYKFSRDRNCCHITAVYESGLLGGCVD